MGGVFTYYFLTFEVKKWIYLHSWSSMIAAAICGGDLHYQVFIFTFRAFSIRFCPKRLTVIQTYIHTIMAVAAMQGANLQIRSSLVLVSCPRTLWHADQGNRPSDLLITWHWLYPWSTATQLCCIMLTADWRNVLYFTNLTSHRREKSMKRENQSLWWVLSQSLPELKHTDTQTPNVIALKVMKLFSKEIWLFGSNKLAWVNTYNTKDSMVKLPSLAVNTPLNNYHCWWKFKHVTQT